MVGLEQIFLENGRPVGRGLRIVRAVLAFALAAVPLLICADQARKTAAVRRRPVVSCVVLSSGVESNVTGRAREDPYRPSVTFAFTFNGRPHVGHRWDVDGRDTAGTGDAADAYAQAARFPIGARARCYVDTTDPSESILVQPVLAWEPLVVPALATVAVAVGVLYCVPQLWLGWTRPGQAPRVPAPTQRRWSAVFWGCVLTLGFGTTVVAWWAVPVVRSVGAARWPRVPCVVETSGVQQAFEGGELPLTLYRTDVLYRYVVNGRTYHSNCYRITETASLLRGGRDRVAAAYPVGQAAICGVDPTDPTSAVLDRHLSPTVAFAALPLAMALLGLLMIATVGVDRRANAWLRQSRWALGIAGAVAVVTMVYAVFAEP